MINIFTVLFSFLKQIYVKIEGDIILEKENGSVSFAFGSYIHGIY